MIASSRFARPLWALGLAAVASLAVACSDNPAEPDDPADAVASIRLTVGAGGTGNVYNVSSNGAVTPTPVRIPVGQTAITADFLDAGGAVITSRLNTTEFEMRMTEFTGTALTFTRTGPYAGTLAATTAGTATARVSLYHKVENHPDFGPFPITLQIGQ
jgi:hypothetical protein